MYRVAVTTAAVLCFLLTAFAAACLSQMDEIPRWVTLLAGFFVPVSGWFVADVWYTFTNPLYHTQPKPH